MQLRKKSFSHFFSFLSIWLFSFSDWTFIYPPYGTSCGHKGYQLQVILLISCTHWFKKSDMWKSFHNNSGLLPPQCSFHPVRYLLSGQWGPRPRSRRWSLVSAWTSAPSSSSSCVLSSSCSPAKTKANWKQWMFSGAAGAVLYLFLCDLSNIHSCFHKKIYSPVPHDHKLSLPYFIKEALLIQISSPWQSTSVCYGCVSFDSFFVFFKHWKHLFLICTVVFS